MRWACLVLVAATLSSTGCAALIAASGCEPQSLTEQRVTEEFGAPPATPDAEGSSACGCRSTGV